MKRKTRDTGLDISLAHAPINMRRQCSHQARGQRMEDCTGLTYESGRQTHFLDHYFIVATVWIRLAVEHLVVFCYKLRHILSVKLLYITKAVLLVNINNVFSSPFYVPFSLSKGVVPRFLFIVNFLFYCISLGSHVHKVTPGHLQRRLHSVQCRLARPGLERCPSCPERWSTFKPPGHRKGGRGWGDLDSLGKGVNVLLCLVPSYYG